MARRLSETVSITYVSVTDGVRVGNESISLKLLSYAGADYIASKCKALGAFAYVTHYKGDVVTNKYTVNA